MKHTLSKLLCAGSAAMLLGLATPSHATPFSFMQGGFSGGGSLSGSFEGADLDGDGVLVASLGEISNFSVSFSGDSLVSNFSHSFSDLFELIYVLGSATLGDDGIGGFYPEGIASNLQTSTGIEYGASTGFYLPYFGYVTDGVNTSTTDAYVKVPAPGSLALLGLGVALLGMARRQQKR